MNFNIDPNKLRIKEQFAELYEKLKDKCLSSTNNGQLIPMSPNALLCYSYKEKSVGKSKMSTMHQGRYVEVHGPPVIVCELYKEAMTAVVRTYGMEKKIKCLEDKRRAVYAKVGQIIQFINSTQERLFSIPEAEVTTLNDATNDAIIVEHEQTEKKTKLKLRLQQLKKNYTDGNRIMIPASMVEALFAQFSDHNSTNNSSSSSSTSMERPNAINNRSNAEHLARMRRLKKMKKSGQRASAQKKNKKVKNKKGNSGSGGSAYSSDESSLEEEDEDDEDDEDDSDEEDDDDSDEEEEKARKKKYRIRKPMSEKKKRKLFSSSKTYKEEQQRQQEQEQDVLAGFESDGEFGYDLVDDFVYDQNVGSGLEPEATPLGNNGYGSDYFKEFLADDEPINTQKASKAIPATPTRTTTRKTAPDTPNTVSTVQVPVERKRARDDSSVPTAAKKKSKHSANIQKPLSLGNTLYSSL